MGIEFKDINLGMKFYHCINDDEFEIYFVISIDKTTGEIKLANFENVNEKMTCFVEDLNENGWTMLNCYMNGIYITINPNRILNKLLDRDVKKSEKKTGFTIILYSNIYDENGFIINSMVHSLELCKADNINPIYHKNGNPEYDINNCRTIFPILLYPYENKTATLMIIKTIINELIDDEFNLDNQSLNNKIYSLYLGRQQTKVSLDNVRLYDSFHGSLQELKYDPENNNTTMLMTVEAAKEEKKLLDMLINDFQLYINYYEIFEYTPDIDLDLIKFKYFIVYAINDDKYYIVLYKEMPATQRLAQQYDTDNEVRDIIDFMHR